MKDAIEKALAKFRAALDAFRNSKKTPEQIEKAKELYDSLDPGDRSLLEYLLPELAESEDERIRKALIKAFKEKVQKCFEWKDGIPNNAVLNWLEKQKENPKSADSIPSFCVSDVKWTDTIITRAIVALSDDVDYNRDEPCKYRREIDDLKKLRDVLCMQKEQKPNIELIQRSWYMEGYHDREFSREPKWIIKTGEGGPKYEKNEKYGQPLEQKPAEWSEDDENMLNSIIATCQLAAQDRDSGPARHLLGMQERFLKSFRSRLKSSNNWKPSDEQMGAIQDAIEIFRDKHLNSKCGSPTYIELCSLSNDLEKLM